MSDITPGLTRLGRAASSALSRGGAVAAARRAVPGRRRDPRRAPPDGAVERAERGDRGGGRRPRGGRRRGSASTRTSRSTRGSRSRRTRASRSASSTTARCSAGPTRWRRRSRLWLDGDRMVGSATFGAAYEGPPGCVHGGYVAAAFDEVLGSTQSLSGSPGHDRPPHGPLPQPDAARDGAALRRVARAGRGAQDLHRAASCGPATRLCAEAEGLFISIRPGKFADLKAERDRRHAAEPSVRARPATRRARKASTTGTSSTRCSFSPDTMALSTAPPTRRAFTVSSASP